MDIRCFSLKDRISQFVVIKPGRINARPGEIGVIKIQFVVCHEHVHKGVELAEKVLKTRSQNIR